MNLVVTESAAKHFMEEWGFAAGDFIRIFVRYGGQGGLQPAFSLGIVKQSPIQPGISAAVNGIIFYLEKDEEWYLSERDLKVDYDEEKQEIVFHVQ